jgi:LysM repeat protein
MWFGRNQKRIKLSRKLNWSVGKSQHTSQYFWFVGSACLLIAVGLLIRTNANLKEQPKPAVLGASVVATPSTASLKLINYTIGRGETLFTISQKFKVPSETLAQLNDISPPFTLKAGQTIKIPSE